MKDTKEIKTKYCCPLCNAPLLRQWGNKTHVGDKDYGITVYCDNRKCPAQEVSGHGNGRSEDTMIANAYAVIMAKCKGENLSITEETEEETTINQPEAVEPPQKVEQPKIKKQKKIKGLPVVEEETSKDDDLV